jgi:hypothetical protein
VTIKDHSINEWSRVGTGDQGRLIRLLLIVLTIASWFESV